LTQADWLKRAMKKAPADALRRHTVRDFPLEIAGLFKRVEATIGRRMQPREAKRESEVDLNSKLSLDSPFG
jgi:hypothetical protein